MEHIRTILLRYLKIKIIFSLIISISVFIGLLYYHAIENDRIEREQRNSEIIINKLEELRKTNSKEKTSTESVKKRENLF